MKGSNLNTGRVSLTTYKSQGTEVNSSEPCRQKLFTTVLKDYIKEMVNLDMEVGNLHQNKPTLNLRFRYKLAKIYLHLDFRLQKSW